MKKREEFDSDLRAAMSDAAKQSPTMTIAIWIAVKISRSLYEQERAKAEATIAALRIALGGCLVQLESAHAVLGEQDFDDEAEAELSEMIANWKALIK